MARKKKSRRSVRSQYDAAAASRTATLTQQVGSLGAFGPPPPGGGSPNRFKKLRQETTESASLGTSFNEAVKQASDGKDDFAKHVRRSIKDQYFTFWQYLGGGVAGFILGEFIAMMFYELGVLDITEISWAAFPMGVGMIVGFLFAIYFYRKTKTKRKCQQIEGVSHEEVGKACEDAGDCTLYPRELWQSGMCRRNKLGTITFLFRWLILLGLLVGGAFSLVTGILDDNGIGNLGFRQILFFIILGESIAFIGMFVFS